MVLVVLTSVYNLQDYGGKYNLLLRCDLISSVLSDSLIGMTFVQKLMETLLTMLWSSM